MLEALRRFFSWLWSFVPSVSLQPLRRRWANWQRERQEAEAARTETERKRKENDRQKRYKLARKRVIQAERSRVGGEQQFHNPWAYPEGVEEVGGSSRRGSLRQNPRLETLTPQQQEELLFEFETVTARMTSAHEAGVVIDNNDEEQNQYAEEKNNDSSNEAIQLTAITINIDSIIKDMMFFLAKDKDHQRSIDQKEVVTLVKIIKSCVDIAQKESRPPIMENGGEMFCSPEDQRILQENSQIKQAYNCFFNEIMCRTQWQEVNGKKTAFSASYLLRYFADRLLEKLGEVAAVYLAGLILGLEENPEHAIIAQKVCGNDLINHAVLAAVEMRILSEEISEVHPTGVQESGREEEQEGEEASWAGDGPSVGGGTTMRTLSRFNQQQSSLNRSRGNIHTFSQADESKSAKQATQTQGPALSSEEREVQQARRKNMLEARLKLIKPRKDSPSNLLTQPHPSTTTASVAASSFLL